MPSRPNYPNLPNQLNLPSHPNPPNPPNPPSHNVTTTVTYQSPGPRAISVRFIPNEDQRYDTWGDWTFDPLSGELDVLVSETGNWRYNTAVAVHEIVEALLCLSDNVAPGDVDEFDIEFEKLRSEVGRGCTHVPPCEEPGACPCAPYRHQHAVAEVVERLLVEEFHVPWAFYEADLEKILSG